MHSVFDALSAVPTCISRPNRLKCVWMIGTHAFSSARVANRKAPSSAYGYRTDIVQMAKNKPLYCRRALRLCWLLLLHIPLPQATYSPSRGGVA